MPLSKVTIFVKIFTKKIFNARKKVNDAIQFRRSVRIFDPKEIDPKIVKDCIAYGVLAPNSNLQLWEFHHITSSEMMNKIVTACFKQPQLKQQNNL